MNFKFLFFAIFIVQLASAQSTYTFLTKYNPPKSPNAAAFEQYLTVPGNYETGQVNPTIPLMSFSVDGLDVPINLNYSNTGLKLNDVATWVGQGWNLNVGGAVTRSVKGIPDDSANGMMNSGISAELNSCLNNTMSDVDKWTYFHDISKQYIDSEHDIFNYDALGTKGAFYINASGNCIQYPKTNSQITFTTNSSGLISTFTVINERGDKFIFSIREESVALSSSYPNSTTWYLSQIQTKNNQYIYFTYSNYKYDKVDQNQSQPLTITGSCFAYNTSYSSTNITNEVNVYQLNQISWKDGYISFNAATNRSDIAEFYTTTGVPSLDNVAMYRSATPFSTTGSSLVEKVAFEYTQTPRLFLNKVDFLGNSTTTDHSYSFTYVAGTPNYPMSGTAAYYAQDYWGYYNGITGNPGLIPYSIISTYQYDDPVSDQGSSYGMIGLDAYKSSNNANRVPDPAYASAGMLQEIYYPTGGKTKFYYEGNMVDKAAISTISTQNIALLHSLTHSIGTSGDTLLTLGGVRAKKIEYYTDPAAAPSTVTNIIYDPATINIQALPSYVSVLHGGNLQGPDGFCLSCTGIALFTVHSSSVIDVPSDVVEYGKVTEYSGTTNTVGQTVHAYNYSNLNRHDSWSPVIFPYPALQHLNYYAKELGTLSQLNTGSPVLGKSSTSLVNDPAIPDLQPNADVDLKIGVYNNDECADGRNVDHTPPYGYASDWLTYVFRPGFTGLVSEDYVPATTFQYSYSPTGPKVVDSTNYNYTYASAQNNPLLPNSTSKLNSKGENTKILYSYPQNEINPAAGAATPDAAVAGILNLISKNLLNIPVEQLEVINKGGTDYVTGGTLVIFYSDKLAVSKVYKLAIAQPVLLSTFTRSTENNYGSFVYDSRYQLDKQYYSYNSAIQPTEYTDKANGPRHTLLWNYNSTYPVADVVAAAPSVALNLNLTDIAYTSFEADDSGNWTLGSTVRLLNGISGTRCYTLTAGNISKSGLTSGTTYVLSYWTTATTPLTITGTQSGYPIAAQTANGWTRYEYHITGQTSITLSGSSVIDELRLYPLGAQMTTYTYLPLVGMTNQVDAKNELTYYTYDNLNRLQGVWDQHLNLLKSYCYNYQGTVVNCPILTPPNTTPGSAVSGIFVHWVQGTYTETTYSDGAGETLNTIYAPKTAYFYSDAACTHPVTLTQGITLELDDTYNTYNATTNASTSTNQVHGTYTVSAGVSSYTVGSVTIHTDREYYDSYGNYLDDTEDYYYYPVLVTGSTYQLVP